AVSGTDQEAILLAYQQFEPRNTPTSYIPTEGAAASRASEQCFISKSKNFSETGDLTMAIECHLDDDSLIHAPDSAAHGQVLMRIYGPRAMSFYLRNRNARYYHVEAGQNWVNLTSPAKFQPHFVMAASVGGEYGRNRRALCINGADLVSNEREFTLGGPSSVDRIQFGSHDGSRSLCGHLRNMRLWRFEATNNQLKGIR
ncbi:MAG: hypothetical protein ACRCVR_06110, partial [Plesiomonas shigelloides]